MRKILKEIFNEPLQTNRYYRSVSVFFFCINRLMSDAIL